MQCGCAEVKCGGAEGAKNVISTSSRPSGDKDSDSS